MAHNGNASPRNRSRPHSARGPEGADRRRFRSRSVQQPKSLRSRAPWPSRRSGHGQAVRLYVVRGDSMRPSFREGDQLVVSPRAYRRSAPSRGDVVVVRDPRLPAREELKRIVGLSGEELRLEDGLLYVDGAVLDEPYLGGLPSTPGAGGAPLAYGGRRVLHIGRRPRPKHGQPRVRPRRSRPAGRQSPATILAAPALGNGLIDLGPGRQQGRT